MKSVIYNLKQGLPRYFVVVPVLYLTALAVCEVKHENAMQNPTLWPKGYHFYHVKCSLICIKTE
jgi:hypothetical protein